MTEKRKRSEANPIKLRTYLDGEVFLVGMLIVYWITLVFGTFAVFQIIYRVGLITFVESIILAVVLLNLCRRLRLQWL